MAFQIFFDLFIDELNTSRFGLQVNEETERPKSWLLITYVLYMLKNCIKEDLLFCKPFSDCTVPFL
jgi:hypothetical protein